MFNHLLTVFVCAADCGSFNKAAEKLYLSAPSVMKQVNALEKQLDMKLFHRTNQGQIGRASCRERVFRAV